MIWITRKKPHIDRIACAWTIKRFIDPKADFRFIERNEAIPNEGIPYDLPNVEIGHKNNKCSHYTLLEKYQLRDEGINEINRIVNDIDMGLFDEPESYGVELIIKGLILSSKKDLEILEKGFQIFDYMYQTLT